MSTTSNIVMLGVVVVAGAIGLAVLKARLAGGGRNAGNDNDSDSDTRFKAKPLLTANELGFLGQLETAMPELRFLAQVAMGALLDPAVPRSDAKAYYRLRGMFSQKIVDYVAQNRQDGSIVAIIELDDRTHDTAKDARRDIMLASAGYRIVRWNSKAKPDAAAIRDALAPPAVALGAAGPAGLLPVRGQPKAQAHPTERSSTK